MTAGSPDVAFRPHGPLPTGRVAIEASAGTGKTFVLAELATRFLAEQDVSPSDLLIVTFTRAATAELRSRIRDQMIEVVRALTGGDDEHSDLVRLLASEDREIRLGRLVRAVAEFDAASISTIHGFATQVRRTLALSSAIDPDARLVASADDLITGACADALAAASVRAHPPDEFPSLDVLVEATAKKLGGPDLTLLPDGTDPDVDRRFEQARELVEDALERVAGRRSGEGTVGFDDVLVQLRDALAGTGAAAVVEAIRSRYKVVLIDEFQDTDRVQWEIFSALFGRPGSGSTLVLVGDPKQAIYRFRGADISVYLRAREADPKPDRFTLTTNWRADGRCLRGLHALLDGATFGSPSIRYVEVRAAPVHEHLEMIGANGAALSGLHVRLASLPDLPRTTGGRVSGDDVNRMVERDVAAHLRMLLETSQIPTSTDDPTPRPLVPSDIAVLVTSWNQAHEIHGALARQGIPAVVAGSGSVLNSDAASQMRFLLLAMERPGDLRRVRTYALSWFGGLTVQEVAAADDRALAGLQDLLMEWATRLADRPVAEVLARIWQQTGVVAHVLGRPDGDRNVTDLDHVAELLHTGAPQGRAGVAGLLAALDAPPDGEADADADNDVTARRIESEAETVLITTVWKAKGLEFPVVCVPMLWRRPPPRRALVFSDPQTGERMIDVTRNGQWPDKAGLDARKAMADQEEYAERLRILYVALTRARHHTAVWWAGNAVTTNALTRLLFARDAAGAIVPDQLDPVGPKRPSMKLPTDPVAALAPMAAGSHGALTVTAFGDRTVPSDPWVDPSATGSPPRLTFSEFDRVLDRSVSRWSFSAMTQFATEAAADPYDASGADRGADDESGSSEAVDPSGAPRVASGPAPSVDPEDAPLGLLRAGTAFGTFVHGVLENVDFAAADIEGLVGDAVRSEAVRWGFDLAGLAPEGRDGAGLLVAGLSAAIRTPLGPLFGGAPLAALARADRLDELGFDLRVGAGGHHPTARDIGRLVERHLTTDHPLSPWAAALAGGSLDVQLAGYLTGSIDLVARVRHADGGDRFVVADYKTNRLSAWGAPQKAVDYGQRPMADAMIEHHYPLQALLYAVALHRYLRWRCPGGDRPTLVSGAAYLFVRGMTGAEVAMDPDGHPGGVFTWELPADLVVELSELLHGHGAGRGGS
jgi:exodeoxyribonuclease V beta subunit